MKNSSFNKTVQVLRIPTMISKPHNIWKKTPQG